MSFDRAGDRNIGIPNFGITGGDFDDSFMLGPDAGIVVVLTGDEIGLLEARCEITSEDDSFGRVFLGKKCIIFREFS